MIRTRTSGRFVPRVHRFVNVFRTASKKSSVAWLRWTRQTDLFDIKFHIIQPVFLLCPTPQTWHIPPFLLTIGACSLNPNSSLLQCSGGERGPVHYPDACRKNPSVASFVTNPFFSRSWWVGKVGKNLISTLALICNAALFSRCGNPLKRIPCSPHPETSENTVEAVGDFSNQSCRT